MNRMKCSIKKIGAMLLVMVMMVNLLSVEAFAGVNKPTSNRNLSSEGKYSGGGTAVNNALYSNHNFTGASKMKYTVINTGDKDITVNIYRTDARVSYYRIKVEAYSTAIWTMSTTSSKKYYAKFSKPCYFKYSVEKA